MSVEKIEKIIQTFLLIIIIQKFNQWQPTRYTQKILYVNFIYELR
jgi:hypothetical protein